MPPHPLTNFKIQKYYRNKPKFHVAYSEINLPKIKDEAYIINLDDYESIGTHWIALYVNGGNVTYFHSFGIEHIPKEIKKMIGIKNFITDIYKILSYNNVRILLYQIYRFHVKR